MARGRPRKDAAPASSSSDEFRDTVKEIRKRYGDSTFSAAAQIHQPLRIPTGIFMLDFATLGGLPHNRVTMAVGERHSGKTTLAYKAMAGAQRMFEDQVPVLIDVEGTHDTVWASNLGVDPDRLHVFTPETGEAAVDAADALVRTKGVSLVVIDSIAALVPMKEIDSSAEDALVGVHARLISSMVRKVTAGLIAERNRGHEVTVLFLNQFRTKIGSMYGDPRSIPGGKALEFSTSLQLIMKNKETMGKDGMDIENVVLNEHAFDIKKNKLNAGPRTGEFRLVRQPDEDIGLQIGDIDDVGTMLTYAKKFGAYSGASSSWDLSFWGEDHHFRGLDDARRTIYADPDLKDRLRSFLLYTQATSLGMPESFTDRFLE